MAFNVSAATVLCSCSYIVFITNYKNKPVVVLIVPSELSFLLDCKYVN